MKVMTNRCFLRCPVWDQSTHHFPNYKKNHDRFKAWVEAIDRKLECDADYEYFRTKRLCHIHFKPIFCYNQRRLSPLAIPTLYLTKQSRDEYWSKDLELRKLMLLQAKLSQEEIADKAASPSNKVEANNEEPLMVVPEEKLPLNNTPSLLQSHVQESLVNSLISDLLKGEIDNYAQDVHKQPVIELSNPSPVKSNVPNPVADIFIECLPTTEVSVQESSVKPRDTTTSEVVENLPTEPVFIHEIPVHTTLLETCAEEIEINFDSAQNCIQQPKKKRKSKYDGLFWELALRIRMEHNYSKASIVAPTSHISSNGVHPKKTIITLKSKVKELRKQLKFYKQKYKDLLRKNQETVPKQIRSKNIIKSSPKGQATQKSLQKRCYILKLKNVGCGTTPPRKI